MIWPHTTVPLWHPPWSPHSEGIFKIDPLGRVKLYDGGLSSIRWKLHISERSSFLKYAVAIIKCPMGGQFMMATAYLFKELVSEICSVYRIELRPPS